MKDSKPFVKWVGGKTQLIKNIENSLPQNFALKKRVTYIEPFVGGGAVLFWMLKNFSNITNVVINDINPDLTNAYSVIRNSPKLLIEFLSHKEREYYALENEDSRLEFYMNHRAQYNTNNLSDIERAGLFVFLNRTCFNGMYRVNKKGGFNVPFGKHVRPKICDTQTILADSEALQSVEILTGDFSQTLDYACGNTLFYFDPPYKPISKTSSFTTYSKEDFNDEDQRRLSEFCQKISDRGYDFILSNSDTKNIDPENNFFDELYNKFNIERINAARMINSNASKRGKISEILVSNTNPKFIHL